MMGGQKKGGDAKMTGAKRIIMLRIAILLGWDNGESEGMRKGGMWSLTLNIPLNEV